FFLGISRRIVRSARGTCLSFWRGGSPPPETERGREGARAARARAGAVAYYRAGRYREAVEVLRPNVEKQEDWALAYDLYLLAMSHHRLGWTARARVYDDWAVRRVSMQRDLRPENLEGLTAFRAEAGSC